MPLYEYKCHKCGHTFEMLQKFSDEPVTIHADCGGEVEKLVSAPAFHLKGTGWYATDYAKTNGVSPKPEEHKTEGKTESKPAEGSSAKESSNGGTSAPATESKPKPAAETKPAGSSTANDS